MSERTAQFPYRWCTWTTSGLQIVLALYYLLYIYLCFTYLFTYLFIYLFNCLFIYSYFYSYTHMCFHLLVLLHADIDFNPNVLSQWTRKLKMTTLRLYNLSQKSWYSCTGLHNVITQDHNINCERLLETSNLLLSALCCSPHLPTATTSAHF
jgi:hypothetical protein